MKSLRDDFPDMDQHPRVLIYTEGVDFAGEQFFDIQTDCLYMHDPDMPEHVRAATHWAPLPYPFVGA